MQLDPMHYFFVETKDGFAFFPWLLTGLAALGLPICLICAYRIKNSADLEPLRRSLRWQIRLGHGSLAVAIALAIWFKFHPILSIIGLIAILSPIQIFWVLNRTRKIPRIPVRTSLQIATQKWGQDKFVHGAMFSLLCIGLCVWFLSAIFRLPTTIIVFCVLMITAQLANLCLSVYALRLWPLRDE